MQSKLWFTVALFAAGALSGCLDGNDDETGGTASIFDDGITTPFERELLDFDVTNPRSVLLNPGTFDILPGRDVYVDVPLPVTEGGQALNPLDPPRAHLGLFLPDIPGCDWDAASLPDMCHVPVIADAGPYYRTPGDTLGAEGDVPAAQRDSGRLGEWLISNFVPKGYAVAQISVMGSGLSNHCFDMFGLAEQLGVHHSVEALGTAPWSNGNVGLIGRSYDGSTPWMAAAHASPHLKTIVPISGLSGLGDLVTWNGASEARVALFQNVVYAQFGLDSHELATDAVTHVACPDWTTSTLWGALGYVEGDGVAEVDGTYWEERQFIPAAVANYEGSLFMIHGLQDDNVDPHAGWIGELALRDNGNDVKAMWGQWYHSYPDRISEHGFQGHPDSIRMDWAQEMLEWFDYYLMENGNQPRLHTQIQQENGPWRVEATWPPADAIIQELALGTGSVQTSILDGATDINLGVLSETSATVLGGFSTVTLDVTPMGPGGQVYVELRDGTDNKDFGLSYGVGELRHLAGEGAPVVPLQSMKVTLPFQLFDAELPAGHELVLRISSSGNGFLPSPVVTPVTVDLAESTLHLSTLQRGPASYFQPPVWYEDDADGNMVQKGQTDA